MFSIKTSNYERIQKIHYFETTTFQSRNKSVLDA